MITGDGKVTISKVNSDIDYVAIKIRLNDKSVTANVPVEDFALALFGRGDVNCSTEIREGEFHGIERQPNTGESS